MTDKLKPGPSALTAFVILISLALLIANAISSRHTSAYAARPWERLAAEDASRRARQTTLKARLASEDSSEFRKALAALSSLDEQGALDVWQAALSHPDAALRKQAWSSYQPLRPALLRKEYTPQVARVKASADELSLLASAARSEVTVWSEEGRETVAAMPPYLVERLRRADVGLTVLYDSIADWQQARAAGDPAARSVTPEYQSDDARSNLQARVAVIDLSVRAEPAGGYSDWLGDRENVLMRNDAFMAYLDVFASDGSAASIASRVEERYARRGYRLAGFYTLKEFAGEVARFFPGRTFDPGTGDGRGGPGEIQAALAEGKYHSYQEALAEFTALAQASPHLARVVNLGPTYENRQVFALKISKDVGVSDPSKPDVLITGCHHAREWISVEPPIYFANRLIKDYGVDDSVTYLVDSLEIWIVPIVNPDGLTYSQESANEKEDAVRLWRKNRRPISDGDCGSSTGADLNRNYDFQWRLPGDEPCPKYTDDQGGSDEPLSELYRGPSPASELEVKAIKALLDDPNHNFRAQLDYHNFSQLILYPWGHQIHSAPDTKTFAAVSQRMSDEIFRIDRKTYRPEQAVALYSTTGTATDYSYGVHGVPMPLVIESRPDCCGFTVSEDRIDMVNAENWAGARMILNWVSGPPILRAVQAFQQAPNGTWSKLVYSARWMEQAGPGEGRQLMVETRFPAIEPGRLMVRLQFSKPMEPTTNMKATLGRDMRLDELRLVPREEGQGWQKTVYMNDTWVGEATILQDDNQTSQWRLAVSASDTTPFNLDAMPATVAGYTAGGGGWRNYEDVDGISSNGGTDAHHLMSPTLRNDFLNLFVGTPKGGERLAGGEPFTIAWTIPKESGFTPVQHDVLLSTDGGANFTAVIRGLPGDAEKALINLPRVATARARVRISAVEGSFGNTLFGDSQVDFTIGLNVNSAAEVAFLSSERVDQNWTDTSPDGAGRTGSGSSRLVINLSVTNRGGVPIASPFLRVSELTRENVLLTRDGLSAQAAGARQPIDSGADDLLSPGETAQARLVIGLVGKKKFNLSVELYGVPLDGAINPSAGTRVWRGKPKSK
jgi:carboxypeptidase T